MYPAEISQLERNAPRRSRATRALLPVLMWFVPAVIALTLLSRAPAHTSEVASEYIQRAPFDAAGYLALATAGDASSKPTPEQLAAINVALHLAPVDPAVLDAATRLRLTAGDVTGAFVALQTLLDAARGGDIDPFAALDERVGEWAWDELVDLALTKRWHGLGRYVEHLCGRDNRSGQARSLRLLLAVAGSQHLPPSAFLCVERLLLQQSQIETAYQVRLLAATHQAQRVDYIFNGDFELPLSGSAFDWTIQPGGEFREGFAAQVTPYASADGRHNALAVRFTGRPVRGAVATQMLALPPGRYQLSYKAIEENFPANLAPAWILTCLGGDENQLSAALTEPIAVSRWVRRSFDLRISKQCVGQRLALEPPTRLAKLEGLRGTVIVDDVTISRIP